MELIKYLKEYGKCYNLSYLEEECGIPAGTLRGVLKGRKKLPRIHGDNLISFLSSLNVKLEYDVVDSRKRADIPEKFNLTGWTRVWGKVWEKGDRMVKLDSNGYYLCDVD
jgi:hypothetical protein